MVHHKWYQSLDLASLCMRPKIHRYYTKSNKREMVSTRKSERSKETTERVVQDEERRPWMNEPQDEMVSGDEEDAQGAQGDRQRTD